MRPQEPRVVTRHAPLANDALTTLERLEFREQLAESSAYPISEGSPWNGAEGSRGHQETLWMRCLGFDEPTKFPSLVRVIQNPEKGATFALRTYFNAVGRGLRHRAVHHARPKVGKLCGRGVVKHDLFTPLLECSEKETRARGNGSEPSLRLEKSQPSFYERGIDVILRSRPFGCRPLSQTLHKGAERRIHQDHIIRLPAHVDEAQSPGRVLSEELALISLSADGSDGIVSKCPKQFCFGLQPFFLVELTK